MSVIYSVNLPICVAVIFYCSFPQCRFVSLVAKQIANSRPLEFNSKRSAKNMSAFTIERQTDSTTNLNEQQDDAVRLPDINRPFLVSTGGVLTLVSVLFGASTFAVVYITMHISRSIWFTGMTSFSFFVQSTLIYITNAFFNAGTKLTNASLLFIFNVCGFIFYFCGSTACLADERDNAIIIGALGHLAGACHISNAVLLYRGIFLNKIFSC
ncbi:uncharacterized protein LOC135378271 [Ornithodoros turicata]|uniref:uncharacterized protein LOC135378271 n=1 Tax=Ornithodoros turicata TaxID=34597 RepID=UPI00313A0DCB